MQLVWAHYPRGGSEKLALLALADWADDGGGSLYPSMRTIARKTCLTESQARRIVRRFIEEGWLDVVGNHSGGAPGSTRQYRLKVDRLQQTPDASPTSRMDATPSAGATPRVDAREGLHGCAETPSAGATQSTKEPSITTKRAAHASRAQPPRDSSITLKAFFEACKERGEEPIPVNDPVQCYAEKVGIPTDLLELAWKEFRARHIDGVKRYRDWRAAFRSCVRDNWYGIWISDGQGHCSITGKGRQVQSAHRTEAIAA